MTRVLNFGIKKSKGKYIAGINQDDLMMPERLKKQVDFLESHPDYVAVGGNIKLFSKENNFFDTILFPQTDEMIRKLWLFLSPFSDPTVMYRRDAFLKTKGYNQNFWPADDVQMWYQLGEIGKLANLPIILTKVRWHNEAGSIKHHRLQIKKTWEVHQWANKNITKASIPVQLFFIIQYLAGQILPPQFNWFVYRLIKKILYQRRLIKDFLIKTLAKIRIKAKVASQPIKLSFSGV